MSCLALRSVLAVTRIVCLLEKRPFSCLVHADEKMWRNSPSKRANNFFCSVFFFLQPPLPATPTNGRSVFILCREEEEADFVVAATAAWAVQCSSCRLICSKTSDRIRCSMYRRPCFRYVEFLQRLQRTPNVDRLIG